MSDQASEQNVSIDQEDMALFRRDVVRYLTIPDEIAEKDVPLKLMKEEVAQLKAEQVELEVRIQTFMKQQDIARCAIPAENGGGILTINQKTSRGPVKKENYQKGIEAFLRKRGVEATYDEVEQEINETREFVSKNGLKRIKK